MAIRLKFWHKILLTLFCFGIAIYCFIIKLPAAFRGYDKELHTAFYFLAAAFLNILFAKRNLLLHGLIFGGLYVFGMLIEHGQVYSKTRWHIPHGRYDPEDVQGNLKGLLLFSAVWLTGLLFYFLTKKNNLQTVAKTNNDKEELIYEDQGQYFLLDFSPGHSEMVIRRINKSDPAKVFNIDLFFKAVHNIHMPTKMEDIRIYRIARQNSTAFKSNTYDRETLYRIDDKDGNSSFIDASVFIVFHNELEMLSSPLGDFTWSEANKVLYRD